LAMSGGWWDDSFIDNADTPENDMNNAQTTAQFFSATDAKTKADVLANIANHYGITQQEALEEVTDTEAESLLDYVTGPTRAAVSLLMKRHGLN